MTVRFGGKALPRRFGYGVATVHSARTAEQFFHRLLIERGAALVEAGKKQVLLTLIGFDHQPGEGEESTLSPQQFNHMQARRVVRYVEDNLCRRGCQALSRIHDMLAQWVGEPVKKRSEEHTYELQSLMRK